MSSYRNLLWYVKNKEKEEIEGNIFDEYTERERDRMDRLDNKPNLLHLKFLLSIRLSIVVIVVVIIVIIVIIVVGIVVSII